jgi:hypothetical protein
VSEITCEKYTGRIKITVDINYNRNFKMDEFKIPDSLNETRK